MYRLKNVEKLNWSTGNGGNRREYANGKLMFDLDAEILKAKSLIFCSPNPLIHEIFKPTINYSTIIIHVFAYRGPVTRFLECLHVGCIICFPGTRLLFDL